MNKVFCVLSLFLYLSVIIAGYIQVCRGLTITAVCLGFFGFTLALVGMKCTKIGGSDTTKARIAFMAGFHFILNGNIFMPIHPHKSVKGFKK